MQVRMAWLVIGMSAFTACWRSSPPPAKPAPPVVVAPPPRPAVPVVEARPESEHPALAKMAGFRDEMCKCTAKPCADQVTLEMTEWGKLIAREGGTNVRATDDDVRKMSEITETMIRCMTTAMTAGLAQGSAASTTARDPGQPRNVAPTALDANRIAGNKDIVPDGVDKIAIARSGKTKLVASFKLCVDVDGNVDQVSKLKSSGFPGYDAKLEREMQAWRYRPFVVNGTPAPVCTAATFIYTQEPPPAAP